MQYLSLCLEGQFVERSVEHEELNEIEREGLHVGCG